MQSLQKLREELVGRMSEVLPDVPLDLLRLVALYQGYQVSGIQKTQDKIDAKKTGWKLDGYGKYLITGDWHTGKFAILNGEHTKQFDIPLAPTESYGQVEPKAHYSVIDGEIYCNGGVFDLDGKKLRPFALQDCKHLVRLDAHSLIGFSYEEKDDDGHMDRFAVVCNMDGTIKIKEPLDFDSDGSCFYNGVCYMVNDGEIDLGNDQYESTCTVFVLGYNGRISDTLHMERSGSEKPIFPGPYIVDFFVYEDHFFVTSLSHLFVYAMDGKFVYKHDLQIDGHQDCYRVSGICMFRHHAVMSENKLWVYMNAIPIDKKHKKVDKDHIILLDVFFK